MVDNKHRRKESLKKYHNWIRKKVLQHAGYRDNGWEGVRN